MAEKLITLNEDDDKKNNQILSNNVDVTAPENIKKQKTDEDLKISKNLIDDKEKVIEEDEAIQLEDITETSEILPGDALFNNVEEIVNAQDSNQDVFDIYQDLDFTKEQIDAISDNHKKTKKFKEDDELIEIYQDLGIDPENILKSINKRNNKEILYNNPEITQPIDDYWDGVLDDISEWAVGNDADWGTYFERGLGKSNINLALQYHLDRGIDYNKVFTAEPGDTGALERALETVTGIFFDAPTFLFGAAGGAFVSGGNPLISAFGAGFLNDSIKEMYIQALESDTPPDSFADWWNIFSHHSLSRGVEGGLNMVGLVGGQKVAAQTIGKLPGVNKYISDFVGRFAGLTLVGSAYNQGELPSKDELVNNAIVLGLFGTLEGAVGGKGGVRAYISKKNLKMLNESAKINKVTLKEKVNEILKDSTKLKEFYSINKKRFSADREKFKERAKFVKEEIKILREQEKNIANEISKDTNRTTQNLELYVSNITKSGKVDKKTAIGIVEHIKEANAVDVANIAKTFKINKKVASEVISSLETSGFIGRSKILGTYEVKTFEGLNVYKEILKTKKLTLDRQIIELKTKEQTPEIQAKLTELKSELKKTIKGIKRERDTVIIGNKINQLKKEYYDLTGKKIDPPKVEKLEPSGKNTFPELNKKTDPGRFAANFIDNKQPVKVMVESIAKKRGIKLSDNKPLTPYELLRLQPGMIGKSFQFLEVGVLKFDNKAGQTYVSKPFKEIIERFSSNKELEIANQYLVAKQTIGIYNAFPGTVAEKTKHAETTVGGGITVKNSRKVINEHKEKYEPFRKEIVEYQKGLLDYLYESGTITKELYTQFKKNIEIENYVPLKRKTNKKEFRGETQNITSSGSSGSLQKRKGSELEIKPPLNSIYENTLSFISMSERNAALGSFFKEIKQFEKDYPGLKLPYDVLPGSKAPKIIKKIELSKAEKEKFNIEADTASIFRTDGHLVPEGALKGGVVKFYEKGKLQEYYIPDYALFNSFKDLSFTRPEGYLLPMLEMSLPKVLGGKTINASKILDLSKLPTKTLRAGITLDPRFMIANGIRDTFAAAIYSKNGFIAGLDTARGMRSYLKRKQPGKHKDLYEAYVRSGGNQSQLLSIDRNYFENMEANAYLKHKVKSYNNVIDFSKNPSLEPLRKLSDIFESGSRLRNYELSMNRLRKENSKLPENKRMTERQMEQRAGFEARDITIDFRKMGAAIKIINQQSAFYNANIQGWTKMYEGFKNPMTNPKPYIAALTYITMPSLLLHSFNYDSEVYQSLSQFEKDMFWIVITNEGKDDQMIFRIPKPFELGIIFGSIPERMMSWAYGQPTNTTIGKEANKFRINLQKTIIPDFNSIKPIIEVWLNKNYSLDVPLVPDRLAKIAPEHRYTYGTSTVSKVTIKALHDGLDIIGLDDFSAMDLDYIYKNWTGQLGQYAFDAIDLILESAEVDKFMEVDLVKPKSSNFYKRLQDMKIVGKFMVRYETANTAYIANFYEEFKKWEQYENTNKLYQNKSDKIDTIIELLNSEEGQNHMKNSYMVSFNEIFQGLFSNINLLERFDSLSPELKYDIIEVNLKIMTVVGKTWQELHNDLQEENISDAQRKKLIENALGYITGDSNNNNSILKRLQKNNQIMLDKLDPGHKEKLEQKALKDSNNSTLFGLDIPTRSRLQGFY